MELDITSDIAALCRVCMIAEADQFTSLHDTSSSGGHHQPSLYEMLEAICAPVFTKSDVEDIIPDLPTKVCPPCRNAIVAAYGLHQQCIETDRRLGELLALKWELQGPGGEEDACMSTGNDDSSHVKVVKEEPIDEFDVPKQGEGFKIVDSTLDMKMEEKGSELSCSACGKVFSSRSALTRHINHNYCDGTSDPKERTCDICKKVMTSVRSLKVHRQKHNQKYQKVSKNAPYYCTICDKKFDRKFKLQRHIVSHREFLTCKNCNQTYKHRSALLLHIKLKRCPIGPGGLQCENCDTTFSSKMTWKKHIEEGNCKQTTTFPCTLCGKVFDKRTRLHYHSYSHRDRVACPRCDQKFKTRSGFLVHTKFKRCPMLKNASQGEIQEEEVQEEPQEPQAEIFPCTICSQTFDELASLLHHLTSHKERIACSKCDQQFTTKNALKVHINRRRCPILKYGPKGLLQQQDILVCRDCHEKFPSKSSFDLHLEEQKCQKVPKPFPCDVCGETFDKRSKLSYHMTCHKERSVCSRCNQTFRTPACLRLHINGKRCPMLKDVSRSMQVASKEKLPCKEEVECEKCLITFSSRRSYFKHTKEQKCQRGAETFPCTICSKTFDKRTRLQYHLICHKEPVACSRCGQTFTTSTNLRVHINRKRCPALKNERNEALPAGELGRDEAGAEPQMDGETEVIIKVEEPVIEDFSLSVDGVEVKLEN